MGYTPVFRTVFSGTLHGRWPDTGLWLCLLALADKNGEIDATPAYIASNTGLDVADVEECIARFMQPDPYSRTKDHDGRRLALIDPDRPWGWRIVNHGKYRERARKQAWDTERTASGKDAERKRQERDAKRDVPTCPDASRLSQLSDSDTNTDSDKEKKVPTEPVPQERDRGAIERVFEHWKAVHGHTKARLDEKRRRVLRAALGNYSADELCEAISGYLNSPHHMGVNDRGTRYDDIELMLRDAKHVDMGLAFARDPPSNLSTLTRKIIANTQDWVPPEMRRGTG